jgi:hypothetical protein
MTSESIPKPNKEKLILLAFICVPYLHEVRESKRREEKMSSVL